MKYRIATIFYNVSTDDTTIKMSEGYEEMYPLLRADIMQDCIGLFTEEYGIASDALGQEWEERRNRAKNGNNAA